MLRLALVIYEVDTRAGMQRQLTQLAQCLSERRVRVYVVSTVAPRDILLRRGQPAPELPDAPVVRVPSTRSPAFELAARAWLAAQGGVDVLWGAGWPETLHAARIGEATGIPVVSRFACSGAHGDFAALAEEPEARALLMGVARHVCISAAIRAEALSYGLPAERLVDLPNGVVLDDWAGEVPLAPLPWDEARTLLFVGRLVRQKRVDVLLEAFARLSERASDLRLAIAGDGPLRGALTDQVERLGLEERVAFLGVRADVVALHRAAELLVLPSEGEGLPNVVLEALAAGTPVVATDVLGTREVVRHEREALLVAPGDAQALEAALWRVLTDASLAARLATRGRARVAEAYDLERVADRAAALFAEVAGSSPRQSASGKRRRRN